MAIRDLQRLVVRGVVCCLISLFCAGSVTVLAAADIIVLPESGTRLEVFQSGRPYLALQLVGWEKNWKYLGFRGTIIARGGASVLTSQARAARSGGKIVAALQIAKTGSRELTIDALVQASVDTPLTYIVLAVDPARPMFTNGRLVGSAADGSRKEEPLPLGRAELGQEIERVVLTDANGQTTCITMDPACGIAIDKRMRIVLADGILRAGQPRHLTLTFQFARAITYYARADQVPPEPGFDQWYEFRPSDDYSKPSELGMEDWLETPAGKHGRIRSDGDRLIYNGRPIKLWGINVCYSACAPEKPLAEKRARFYARYGINAVRLHKFADGPGWAGIQSADSFARFDPAGLDRMDYHIAQLKRRGIYVELSAHFGTQKLGPADEALVPYLREFGSFSKRTRRIETPHSAVHYSPELQAVQIRQMVNLLHHKNPYTGLTYAADPAIAFIEIINEQSILFYSSMVPLKASPTLRRYVAHRFCEWLRKKYGSQHELVKQWGPKALDSFANEPWVEKGENLAADNILPLGNPWYWDPVQLNGSQSFQRQRLLDTLQFLYELQNEFYARYVKAVRAAGYDGEIVASNWQAGRALSHFCNLRSDALVGTVDRHNYFGGGDRVHINNATMLAVPGSGTLSAGMQQVDNRPFMLSEWIHVHPNEWGVEGPAIIGAYGMGLQGWDVSFMFQNRDAGSFSTRVDKNRWDVTVPNVLGIFPAVARQVLRGDVKEGQIEASLNVHMPSLFQGKLGFEDNVVQKYDVKTFTSDKVPATALAVARCSVRFTDRFEPTPVFDITRYMQAGTYTACTGQLRWRAGREKLDGAIAINTRATQAVIGFAKGQVYKFDTVTIVPKSRYAAIYVTAKEPDRTLADSSSLLVVAIARARNTDMKIFHDDTIISAGHGPIVMEPVRAAVTLHRQGNPTVHLLDHSGRRTGKTLPVVNHAFEIDGARDRTCYYLIEYAKSLRP